MTIFREKLWASVWVFLALALVIPASLLVFWQINVAVGFAVAGILYAGCVALLIAGSPVIEVTEDAFRAGRARLPLEFVGETSAYREPEATLQRGRLLDARAWLLIRGWVQPVIKIEVTDPKDPVPYWLISTRNPDAVIDALRAARAAAKH